MPSSYMNNNQSNSPREFGLDSDDAIIHNVIVNKNIIVVQFNYSYDYNPYDANKLITCRTTYSTNFGQTWTNIDLNTGSKTFENMGVEEWEKYGSNGCISEFIIRNSSGTKFLIYTPVYKLTRLIADYTTITPRRQTRCVGWLVHNQNGALVNDGNFNVMPEHQPKLDDEYFQWMDIDYNKSTTKINDYKLVDPFVGQPYFGYPIAPHSDSHYSGTYNAQRVVNRTDTVDYVSGGKRYTIVKRYYNVYVRRGDIIEERSVGGIDTRISVGYFVLTLPFIYVFDHTNFNGVNKSLSWVDVLGLDTHLAKLKDYLRPTRYIHSFIKSLISEDKEFHEDVFPSRIFAKLDGNSSVASKSSVLSLLFENTPHGELMKVHDSEAGKDLLGLIFGNRRYVCTGNPLSAANWILGETKRHHRHPTEKRAFYYRRQLPGASVDTRYVPGRRLAPSYNQYGLYYKKYDTFNLTHQNLRMDIASDRVVAIPDRAYSDTNDLVYRFAYFIKDPATGRYSIGLRSQGVNVGVQALSGQPYEASGQYPLVVNRALGIGYSTASFIAREPLGTYSNPLLPADNLNAPDTTVDGLFNQFYDPDNLDDFFSSTGHTVSTYCTGFQKVTKATHSSGMQYSLATNGGSSEATSTDCGYSADMGQPSLAIKLRVIKNLNNSLANSKKYYALVDCVLKRDKTIILRPTLADFADWDFKITNNSVTITFVNPTQWGLTAQTATHTLVLGQTTTITTPNVFSEVINNPSNWRAAVCEANQYETLGSTGGAHRYNFTATRTGDNVTLVVENGPILSTITKLTIAGVDYPFVEAGTVVPYSALVGAASIEVS